MNLKYHGTDYKCSRMENKDMKMDKEVMYQRKGR